VKKSAESSNRKVISNPWILVFFFVADPKEWYELCDMLD